MHHREQDARSLVLHAAAADLMRSDEALIQRALDNIDAVGYAWTPLTT